MEYERDEFTDSVIKRSFSTTVDGRPVEHVELLGSPILSLADEPSVAVSGVHAWTSHNDRTSSALVARDARQ